MNRAAPFEQLLSVLYELAHAGTRGLPAGELVGDAGRDRELAIEELVRRGAVAELAGNYALVRRRR